jgi:hypothetical protein
VPVRSRDFTGAMRAAGGVLLALGAVLVLARRENRWSDFELLLVLAVPAAALFALAVAGARTDAGEPAESWRAVLLVVSVLLAPLALFKFLNWIGASTSHLLFDAAVLLVTALIAAAGARRAQAPYTILLAGLALLGAWMLVWIKIFPDPSGNTVRWLLLGGGVALLLAAVVVDLAGAMGAGELATVGALGAVLAGLLGVFISVFTAAFAGLVSVGDSSPGLLGHVSGVSGEQTTGWDIYLLVVAVALIVLAARSRIRGPGYVGALGLILFLLSTIAQLAHIGAGHAHSHGLLGWPVVLLVLGLAGLAAPLLRRRYT